MKKIAYIGYKSHQITRSTQFFIDNLCKNYEVDTYWSLPFSYKYDEHFYLLKKKEYHAIVIFQIFPDTVTLKSFKCQNIILIPMYDDGLTISYYTWSMYYSYKFICFSKNLYKKLNFLGINNTIYLQYAPKQLPNKYSVKNNKVKLFFWQRSTEINWRLIKKLFHSKQLDAIHFHSTKSNIINDGWFERPSPKDIKKYKITFSSWFKSKEDLLTTISKCDIFIAPRLYEGIGQAFLEAMSMGKCVISPDFPTMNEYITHGKNGLLFDFNSPKKIDISNYKKIGQNAKKSIRQTRIKWEKNKLKIIQFIDKDIPHTPKNILFKSNLKKLKKENFFQQLPFIYEDFRLYDTNYKTKSKSIEFSRYLNLLRSYLNQVKTKQDSFIIYGAGTGAELILNLIPEKISFIVDSDYKKQGKKILNKKIYALDKLKTSNSIILISVFGRSKEITQFLTNEHLIERKRILSLDL
ncbi:MAG: glycosyltransferase [Pseudomonadota bacterium]